jgi:hypothetical protein
VTQCLHLLSNFKIDPPSSETLFLKDFVSGLLDKLEQSQIGFIASVEDSNILDRVPDLRVFDLLEATNHVISKRRSMQ